MFGGYICGWLARRAEIGHGLGMIALSLVLGIMYLVSGRNGGEPLWYALCNIAAMTGGIPV